MPYFEYNIVQQYSSAVRVAIFCFSEREDRHTHTRAEDSRDRTNIHFNISDHIAVQRTTSYTTTKHKQYNYTTQHSSTFTVNTIQYLYMILVLPLYLVPRSEMSHRQCLRPRSPSCSAVAPSPRHERHCWPCLPPPPHCQSHLVQQPHCS